MKGDPCYKVAEILAELCSVGWQVKLVCNELAYLGKEISKQSGEGRAWFLIIPYSKIEEGREKLKIKLLREKEPEL